jgi:drug/metabolite transporter (DMT)-like permease
MRVHRMIAAVAPLALIDWVCLGALYVIWGSTYYALRIALESMPPFLMAGMRFLVAGALLYAFLRLRGAARPTARQWWAAAKVGILLLTISNGAVTFSEQWIGSGLAAVVVATMPLWTAVFGRLSGQRPSRL